MATNVPDPPIPTEPTTPNCPTLPRERNPDKKSVSHTIDCFTRRLKPSSRRKGDFSGVGAQEESMTEEELRNIFEEEETQRFINTFHEHIDEVTLPTAEDQYHGARNKMVIIPEEDAEEIARAGAAPPNAEVETAPKSLDAQLPHSANLPDPRHGGLSSDDSSDDDYLDGEPWVDVDVKEPKVYQPESALPSKRKHVHKQRPERIWGSERAAAFVVPYLPQGRAIQARNRRGGKHAKFTVNGLRVAGQRAYVSMYPFYVPFFLGLWDIARWINWWRSARLCTVFWILWWYNMLLPAFMFYLVWQLLRHRLLPYPTLEQLKARRQAALDAERLGGAFISFTSHSGEWTSSEGKSGLGHLNMGIAGSTAAAHANAEATKVHHILKTFTGVGKGAITGKFKKDKEVIDPEAKMSTVEDDRRLTGADAIGAGDWRRILVLIIEELADFHERAKNLFLWRRPESSSKYTMVLFVLGLVLMIVPTKYLVKGTYAALGFAYWFVIPTICAMTRKQRAMFPPPLYDIPTDAGHAMEIIAQCVARGDNIIPDKKQMKALANAYGDRGTAQSILAAKSTFSVDTPVPTGVGPVESFPDAAASMQQPGFDEDIETASLVSDGSSAIDEEFLVAVVDRPNQDAFAYSASTVGRQLFPELPGEVPCAIAGGGHVVRPAFEPQTYTAYYKHIPGILTLTNIEFEFTPFLRSKAKIHMELDRIRGVRKQGSKTLFIRYIEPVTHPPPTRLPNILHKSRKSGSVTDTVTVDNPEAPEGVHEPVVVMAEKEEKFKYVARRNEVFARIVASRRHDAWIPV